MEPIQRKERAVVAVLFWPLTVGLTAIAVFAAVSEKQAVLASIRNPFFWLVFLLWAWLARRALKHGTQLR